MVVGFVRTCPGLGTHVTIQYYVTTRIRLLEFQQKKYSHPDRSGVPGAVMKFFMSVGDDGRESRDGQRACQSLVSTNFVSFNLMLFCVQHNCCISLVGVILLEENTHGNHITYCSFVTNQWQAASSESHYWRSWFFFLALCV